MDGFGKRHDTTDTTDFCPRQLVTDLLRGNWCDGLWAYFGGKSAAALFPKLDAHIADIVKIIITEIAIIPNT